MASRIEFKSDKTGATEQLEGSDRRINVSARADNRAYYNSRDEEQCYTLTFDHPAAGDGQYSFYLKNISKTKTMVVSSVGLNAANIARFKLFFVTGTAADGISATPVNLNKHSSNDADVTALTDGGGTTISGLSVSGAAVDDISVVANGHAEMRLSDRVRLGQNDAIALEMDTGTSTPLCYGVVFFYLE